MTEEFLQYLWKHRLVKPNDMFSTNGFSVEILHPGIINKDSGPDFLGAKIRIGKTIWAGNVEIHLRASDWYAHRHDNDEAYDNVILHVVWDYDKPVLRKNKEEIPCLSLKGIIDVNLFEKYQTLQISENTIPCAESVAHLSQLVITSMIEYSAIQRLERKTTDVKKMLGETKNDWEEVLYRMIARYFGARLNAYPFELLAQSLPLKTLIQHSYNSTTVEALLFGQAGILDKDFCEEYPLKLKKEYEYLRKKLQISPISYHLWKWFRARPVNLPTIRIAQFAGFIQKNQKLFSLILEAESASDILQSFNAPISKYWENHYVFDKISIQKKSKTIGEQLSEIILINAVVPVLFAYGKYRNEQQYCDKSLKFLEEIKPEVNTIINLWKKMGISAGSALDTQGLIELKNNFCNKKSCLYCKIGHSLLSTQ